MSKSLFFLSKTIYLQEEEEEDMVDTVEAVDMVEVVDMAAVATVRAFKLFSSIQLSVATVDQLSVYQVPKHILE